MRIRLLCVGANRGCLMTTAEIITIGTEIIAGQIVNLNAQHIAKKLTEKGIHVLFQTSVGDDKELLKSTLRIASDRVNLIITTGGLGTTANDITRKVISAFFNIPLIPDEESRIRLQKYFSNCHTNRKDEYRRQCLIPEGAITLHTDNGIATGFAILHEKKEIVCLPGAPREMQPLLHKYMKIYAKQHKLGKECRVTRSLHTFGASERIVEDAVKGCRANSGQTKAITLVRDGVVTINIHTTAEKENKAVRLLDKAERAIRRKLGYAVFGEGDETLEYAVFVLLNKKHKTIAVAESCTGGSLSDKLTNISGISKFFLEGVVVYSNNAKVTMLGIPEKLILRHGAVSLPVAKAMAKGIKKKASADIGVGITGIAGPTGATPGKPVGLVYIAVAKNGLVRIRKCRFAGSRIDIKNYSVNTALNMVRLVLLDVM
ncbi:MAG: competence/damage-inducible protein A [Candidatus Brocadia sp. UTAMX1]|nr:MAG: competence/damage-inducible protein A [Candidatus Brocadia sp. UTAMX1]